MKLLVMQFSPLSRHSIPLWSNIKEPEVSTVKAVLLFSVSAENVDFIHDSKN
jgi:hypothetical protein